jgi:hypothetical protein
MSAAFASADLLPLGHAAHQDDVGALFLDIAGEQLVTLLGIQ